MYAHQLQRFKKWSTWLKTISQQVQILYAYRQIFNKVDFSTVQM